jgi:Uma2 family endonuclease
MERRHLARTGERAMSTAAEKRRYTPEEYLALERKAPYKSEYYRGEIFAMSGVSREHNQIAGNIYRSLGNQFEDRPCEAFIADLRVRVLPTGLYTYPDVAALCGEPRFEDEEVDTLLNPSLVVEVLSPSTEDYDRKKKFDHYRRIDSLREYVLVSQDRVRVERFTRQGRDWLLTIFERRDETLGLASVNAEIPLRAIYARVEVPDAEDGPAA